MEYRYNAASIYAMSLRADHNTGADKIGASRRVGEVFQGNEIWTCTEDLYNAVGTQINKAGDTWLHVAQAGSEMLDCWVALVHLGRIYCAVTDSGYIPEPTDPPSEGVRRIIEVMVTYETMDGRVLIQKTVPFGEPTVV